MYVVVMPEWMGGEVRGPFDTFEDAQAWMNQVHDCHIEKVPCKCRVEKVEPK